MKRALWRAVIQAVGGFYDIGRFSLGFFDSGFVLCKDRVVRYEWRLDSPLRW